MKLKLNPEELIVIYDDIDIEVGKIRIKKSGGPGTHNGMRNIVQMLSSENFARIRVGTDKPKFKMDLAEYVLMPFTKDEEVVLKNVIENSAKATERIVIAGVQSAMNDFNGM